MPLSPPRSLRLLVAHLWPHRRAVAFGALLGLLGGIGTLAEPLVAMAVVDALGEGSPLGWLLALLTVLVVGGAALAGLSSYVLHRTAESMVAAARRRLVSHILLLRVPELDRLKPGDLLSRVTSDTTYIRSAAGQALVDSGSALLVAIGSIVLMAWIDLPLLLVCLAVIGVIGVGSAVMMPPIRRANERSQRAVGEVGALVERALGGQLAERRDQPRQGQVRTAWRVRPYGPRRPTPLLRHAAVSRSLRSWGGAWVVMEVIDVSC